jgi:NAD(P)-dependent dehydrogenase (short-subunit alcohol dehydrogenase family)
MSRTFVVTGAASGIGRATAELLAKQGDTVITSDLHDAQITADLTTPAGRDRLVAETGRLSGGRLDGVLAIAGLATATPATVAVNYFGMTATLDGLRSLLTGSPAPRAVGVSSMASLMPTDAELVDAMLAGDEPAALARAEALTGAPEGAAIYASTKVAFSRWIRRHAARPEWAGAGIPLNAIAPGIIRTPMVEDLIDTPEKAAALGEMVPMPLNGFADAIVPAYLLAWLVSPENTHLCGQVIFLDGGSDAVIRGDATW